MLNIESISVIGQLPHVGVALPLLLAESLLECFFSISSHVNLVSSALRLDISPFEDGLMTSFKWMSDYKLNMGNNGEQY